MPRLPISANMFVAGVGVRETRRRFAALTLTLNPGVRRIMTFGGITS
jgi:hypothetical protein